MGISEFFHKLNLRHENLKKFVHTKFRVPLTPRGQKIMGFIYFLIPIVGGYFVMQLALAQAEVNLGKDGSKLRKEYLNDNENENISNQNQALDKLLKKTESGL